MIQPGRRDFDQSFGQFDRRRIRHPQIRHMGHAIQLLSQCRIELRMPMAMQVAPHAAGAVEIFATVDVDQRAAVGALDHKRLILGHLREGVPDDFAIPAEKFVARRHASPFHDDRCPHSGSQQLRSTAVDDGDFQEAAGANERGPLSRLSLTVGRD